jgi:hypothetical protein
MEKIIIVWRFKEGEKKARLRFRLREGRAVDVFHKSNIMATVSDLDKFEVNGELKPRVTIYNKDLFEDIQNEKALIKKAYKQMVDKGTSITSANLEAEILSLATPAVHLPAKDKTLVARLSRFVEEGYRDGVFGLSRLKHYRGSVGKLSRYLRIHRKSALPFEDFTADMLMDYRIFLFEEYEYVDKYPAVYKEMKSRDIPTERRKGNTIVGEMKFLRTFFAELEDKDEIGKSPFRKLGAERRKIVMKTTYDDPVFLRKEELQKVMAAEVPDSLKETKDAFVLHCAIGFRIGDFQRMMMDNVSVSPDGIPYIHYLPQKTKTRQSDNHEIETPLMRFALDIIKRTEFNLPILRYPSGKSGYNKKIKKLLEAVGIDRKVAVFDEAAGENKYVPLYEVGSSKLARKTHVDLMNKVQVNMYAAGLHREGSKAVKRYTMMELKDRFALMCVAFGAEQYKVDQNLDIIH